MNPIHIPLDCSLADAMLQKFAADDDLSTAKKRHAEIMNELADWLRAHGNRAEFKGKSYFVGLTKTRRARSNLDVLQTALEASGGALEDVAECLSANAWKVGACGKLFTEETAEDLFETNIACDEMGEQKETVKSKPAGMATT